MRSSLLLALAALGSADYPVPPKQTEKQKEIWQRKAAEAKLASEAARDDVLAFLSSRKLRWELRKCCPHAAGLAPEALLDEMRAQFRVAELAHAFPSVSGIFDDMTLETAAKLPWFMNEWQASLMTSNETKVGPQDSAETSIFGCEEFKNSTPTWEEASDRLIYVAQNLRQLDTGSNQVFGDVTAIFSTQHVREMVLISPVDTGYLTASCDGTSLFPKWVKFLLPFNINCDAWAVPNRTVGTLDHFDHLLLPHFAMLWGSSMVKQAALLFKRSPVGGRPYDQIPRIRNRDILRYFESNILGNPRLPEGVRFLIGSFTKLFGTESGRQLQQLALLRRWPLLWALGDADRRLLSLMVLPEAGNQRFLDPVVANLTNASLPPAATANFEELWSKVAAERSKGNLSSRRAGMLWKGLQNAQLRMAPLSATSCADQEGCVGTTLDNECVCVPSAEILV